MNNVKMNLVCMMVVILSLASVFGAETAYAQGSVSGVSVTTSISSVRINIGSATGYGASATTGTPQPDKEWKVIGPPTYSWSASLGTASPNDAAETSVTTVVFNSAYDYSSTASCVVSYQVQKSDPGQSDDGEISTISGQGSNSVLIQVGDFSLSVAPSSLTLDSGAVGGATIYISYINGGPASGIALSSSIAGPNPGDIGVSFGNSGGPNASPNRIPLTVSSADGTNDGLTDQSYMITITGTAGTLTHTASLGLTVTPKPGLYIQYGATSTKSLLRNADNTPTLDANGDQIWVPVADLPGQGTYGLPLGSPPDAGPDYNHVSLTYTAVRSGRWVEANSHYDWTSGLKGTEDAGIISYNGGPIPDFSVSYDKSYNIPQDGTSGTTIEGDGSSLDSIGLGYFEDPSNPPVHSAHASFVMDLHDEYQSYTDHSHDVTDWSDPGVFKDKVSGTSGKAGDMLIISGTILQPVEVEFEIGTTDIPVPWLDLLGIRTNIVVNRDWITVPEGVSTTADAPGEYVYAVVGKHYTEHTGSTYHYTSAGYVGEVPLDYKEPNEDSPYMVTYHRPFEHTNPPVGGP